MNAAFWLAAWIAASLPWRSSNVFGIAGQWPKLGSIKPLWLTLLESLALYSAVFAAMFAIETQRGQRASQAWQFWVIALCLWVVLAFPAAAWFKLRKQ
jgi:heme/copper-type cytochrome/quinol oxidase subunit 3